MKREMAEIGFEVERKRRDESGRVCGGEREGGREDKRRVAW